MATQGAEIRTEQPDVRGVGRRPDLSWGRLLAVGAGAVVASAIANVLIAQALASLVQVPAASHPYSQGPWPR